MAEDSAGRKRERDGWDKAEIILKPVGGLFTAIAVAVLGFWTSNYVRSREVREAALRERLQTRDTNARLYSELTSRREESESALRKDMFKSIIDSFLRSGQATPEQEVLNLELLVYNFHESLNLKPLFRHIERVIKDSPLRAEYTARLNRVAGEVVKKQMLVILEGGTSFDATANLKTLSFRGPAGDAPSLAKDLVLEGIRRNFKLEVLDADRKSESLQLRVTVRTGQGSRVETTSTEFWLDYFDFPMIDNTRLPHDQRFAVILNNFDAAGGSADITLAFFPGKYTGLREKPYYDEVLAKLLAEGGKGTPAETEPAPAPK
ncbi:MAG TPA: hypothetical protein VJ776_01855 [Thermoanaerobaculia bacterium]|nr:hypothetical protein [Thermoanaerobaculia bacterium]